MWNPLDLFTKGLSETIGSFGKAVDDNVTSDEERLTLKNELVKIQGEIGNQVRTFEAALESELTKRNETDSKADSWLTRNIRPLTLIFLIFNTVFLAYATIFCEITEDKIKMIDTWIPLLTALDVSAVTFYFGSRGFEKVKGYIVK